MVVTGVAKSVTSRRRCRFFGNAVPAKSSSIFPPSSRTLTGVAALASEMTTRPSPFSPRRKSTPAISYGAFALLVGNAAHCADADRLRLLGEGAGGVREIQRDACRRVGGEAARLVHGRGHHELHLHAIACECRKSLVFKLRRCVLGLRPGLTHRRQHDHAEQEPVQQSSSRTGARRHVCCHRLYSTHRIWLPIGIYSANAKPAWRSCHPPSPSGTISTTSILFSLIWVIRP